MKIWLNNFKRPLIFFGSTNTYILKTGLVSFEKISNLIVNKGDFLDPQPFFLVQLLLLFENSLIEELLKLLVAIVDAELLEAVDGEVLEAGDVQNSNVI